MAAYITETNIGRRCRVRNAIIDKNVRLSERTSIGYDRAEDDRRGLKTVPITGERPTTSSSFRRTPSSDRAERPRCLAAREAAERLEAP